MYLLGLKLYRIVILSDYKLIKEIYSQDFYSGRQGNGLLDIYGDGKQHGILQ
jgi:hypothetical protein